MATLIQNLGILAFSLQRPVLSEALKFAGGYLLRGGSPGDMIPMAEWRGCEHGRFEHLDRLGLLSHRMKMLKWSVK